MMRSQFKARWAHRMQTALRRRARRTAAEPSIPVVPPTSDWDEAFSRVESYLRAHRIESRVLLNQLATDILTDARTLALEHPQEPPVTLALQVTHARIGEWLVHALGEGDWADERFRARGRLAILMANIPRQCPEHFLTHENLPAEVERGLATAELQSGPELKLARMPSAELEFPLAELVEEKWETFSQVVFLRTATSWIVLITALGVVWFLTR
jgi:hypothetical protein